ncbi:MAG TPA: hypothetical protein DD733_10135, partial [Clostridiales bacterium]|nr:hypothetical protein [Clostridiales bacterium]
KGLSKPEDKDRWVVASWSKKIDKNIFGSFEATLNIFAVYTPKIIADVSVSLSEMKVAVTSISTRDNAGEIVITVGVKCSGIEHLNSIMSNLKKNKNIRDITRGNLN